MALLSQAQLDKVVRIYMRRGYARGAYLKPALSTAAANADAWADANAAEFNQALNAAYRNNATVPDKTILLSLVILERAGILDGLLPGAGD